MNPDTVKLWDLLIETAKKQAYQLSVEVLDRDDPDSVVRDAIDGRFESLMAGLQPPYNPYTPYNVTAAAQSLSYLILALCHRIRSDALYLCCNLIPKAGRSAAALRNVREGLAGGRADKAREALGTEGGFRYNPATHDLEYGWDPPAKYQALSDPLDPERRARLMELAYLVGLLPDEL